MMPPKGKYNEKGDMTDEGMLEYLEDIIGSNKFIEPIKEMETKVEQLNEDRALKLSNVKMVEKEKDSLEGGKTEAEAYLVQENEVRFFFAGQISRSPQHRPTRSPAAL